MSRSSFPLFHSHLDLAHHFFRQVLRTHAIAIDATCGNGHDTLFLAEHLIPLHGQLIAIDIQQDAIDSAKMRCGMLSPSIEWHCQCHAHFPPSIKRESVSLIVYNLGYLPGKDKLFTTCKATTLKSVENALHLIAPGGLISITCYPGHDEGAIEEASLLAWTKNLPPQKWSCNHIRWQNRNNSPSLLLIQRELVGS